MVNKAISVFFASLPAPIGSGVYFAYGTNIGGNGEEWTSKLLSYLSLFFVGYMICLVIVLLFGVPIFLLAIRNNFVRWWTALLAGGITGVLFAAALRLPSAPQFNDFLLFSKYGVTVSMTFFIVYQFICSRHDSSMD